MAATACSRLYFGSASGVVELMADSAQDWTRDATAETYAESIARKEHMDAVTHSYDTTISVSTLYYNEVAEQVRKSPDTNYILAVMDPLTPSGRTAVTGFWTGGQAFVDGISETAPSTDAITYSAVFRPAEYQRWGRGLSVTDFSFSSGDSDDVSYNALTGANVWYLVVDKNEPSDGTRAITVGGTVQNVKAGIHVIDLSSARDTTIKFSATGSTSVSGTLLQGITYTTPQEVS